MSVGVGLPMRGLSRSGSHKSYTMRGVLYEAWEPRASKDPDIDRSRTPYNIYSGPRSAEDIASAMDKRVAEFSAARKRSGGRAIKADAQFAAALIIKPERAWISSLSDSEKLRFFDDAKAVTCELLGVQPMGSVIHVDEQAWHMHLAFLAELPDGTINYDAVFGLKGKKRLNAGFAEAMRERGGWDITPAELYDADRAQHDAAYKASMARKRKEHNQNSAQYKARRDQQAAEAAQRAAEAAKASAMAEAVRIRQRASEAAQMASDALQTKAEGGEAAQILKAAQRAAEREREAILTAARQEAERIRAAAQPATPIERQLLDIAKRAKLTIRNRDGRPEQVTMYDQLTRKARAEGVRVPEQPAPQQSYSRRVDDLPDF